MKRQAVTTILLMQPVGRFNIETCVANGVPFKRKGSYNKIMARKKIG